jgi:hypothetical protein
MKKINVLWLILDLIFLVIFNAIFFVIGGTEHNTSVWASYGFIHFEYLMQLLTPKLIRKGKSAAVFGFSLYSISATYFLIEFVTGIVFILISPESFNAAFLVQLCIAGLYDIMLVSHLISNEYTAVVEEKRQSQIAFVKDASVKVKNLLDNVSDREAKKKVERVYDTIYSSPVKSHPNLEQKEIHILQSIDELGRAVTSGNKDDIIAKANSLLSLINERNSLLKTFN